MKEELKKTYRGFLGWIRYVKDYKDNIDNDLVSEQRLIDANKKIEKLEKDLNILEVLNEATNELLFKREKRIKELNNKVSEIKKEIKKAEDEKVQMQLLINELSNKIEFKDNQNRVNVSKVAVNQRRINAMLKEKELLKEEIEKKDRMIAFLKTNRRAPTKEEILAYELQMKEVEKRIKNK